MADHAGSRCGRRSRTPSGTRPASRARGCRRRATRRARRRRAPSAGVRKASTRQPQAAEGRLEQQEDRDRGARSPNSSRRSWAALQLGRLAQHLGVVRRAGTRRPSSRVLDVADDRAEVAALDVRRRRRSGATRPRARSRSASARSARRPRRSSGTRPPSGVSIGRFSTSVDAVARGRDAPDVDVVGLAAVEDVADLLAREQRRRLAADVARLEAVAAGRGQVRPRPRFAARPRAARRARR